MNTPPARNGPVPPKAPILDVAHLEKTYRPHRRGEPDVVANVDLSLQVHAGEVVALLGPNGAGKSTFLRQIAGQLLPTSGTIRVAGIDMIRTPILAKGALSVIPQEIEPIGSLTVEEHVRYYGLLKGWASRTARAETERLLKIVGLTEHRNKLVRHLSGGLKRRVLLAVTIAGAGVQALLLDEPTTGLDPEGRRSVWAVIRGLQHEGLAILLTTHYIEEAEALADRVVVIHGGRFVLQGTPAEIKNRLPYRGRLEILTESDGVPERSALLDRLGATWRVSYRDGRRIRFEVPDPFSRQTLDLLAEVQRLGFSASLAAVSLEDAYLSAVGGIDP
jgi:ABC-2 type transport system ATP-binding protein